MEITKDIQKDILYSSSMEYILDECRRIEILLQISIKKTIRKNSLANSNFQGLFIDNKEANSLIDELSENHDEEFTLEIEKLKNQFIKLTEEIIKKGRGLSRRAGLG